jgi:hypothetical protein
MSTNFLIQTGAPSLLSITGFTSTKSYESTTQLMMFDAHKIR